MYKLRHNWCEYTNLLKIIWFKDSVKNGGWSTWGQWISLTPCSKLCGKGSKIVVRRRSCSNPVPRCGGKICHGDSVESQTMNCYIHKLCGSKGKWIFSLARYSTKITFGLYTIDNQQTFHCKRFIVFIINFMNVIRSLII